MVLGEVVMPGNRVGRKGWGLSLFKTEPWIFCFRCIQYGKFHSFLIILGSQFLNGDSLQSLVASCRGKHVRSASTCCCIFGPGSCSPSTLPCCPWEKGAGNKGKSASASRKLQRMDCKAWARLAGSQPLLGENFQKDGKGRNCSAKGRRRYHRQGWQEIPTLETKTAGSYQFKRRWWEREMNSVFALRQE